MKLISLLVNATLLLFIGITCTLLGALIFCMHHSFIDLTQWAPFRSTLPTIVLDDQGKEWARFQRDRRTPITLSQIPLHVRNAFIAAEDWQFFSHGGISYRGIIRSLLINMYYRKAVQGASTITQQLIKLVLGDSKKTLHRKIKEQILSIALEYHYSKTQILEAYLNNIYFGCGIYGVQAASQRFWGININEVSIAQAATLAGIVQSPNNYCPLTYPLSSLRRRNTVLYKMRHLGFITDQEYNEAYKQHLDLHYSIQYEHASHLKESIRLFVKNNLHCSVYHDSLTIKTTLNLSMQQAAQDAFTTHLNRLRKKKFPYLEGALVSIEGATGEIKAMIGGLSHFDNSQFNRALQARRQIGSTFKPLLYAQAIEEGKSFADCLIDEPLVLPSYGYWTPQNDDKQYTGSITLAYALIRSNNIASVKLLLSINIDTLIAKARNAGLNGPFHKYPSLALGTIDASTVEVVGLINIFAQHGTYVSPYFISSIQDKWGTILFRHQRTSKKIFDSIISDQVAHVLKLCAQRMWQRTHLPPPPYEVICKTGTTNDLRTVWFVGATPEYTTAIYLGNDDNSPLTRHAYPIYTAFPIWKDVHSHFPVTQKYFTHEAHLKEIIINKFTGASTDANDKDALAVMTRNVL